jgi:hypothetical protein
MASKPDRYFDGDQVLRREEDTGKTVAGFDRVLSQGKLVTTRSRNRQMGHRLLFRK